MSDLHTIKFLLITLPNSPFHRAFTMVVKALWDGEFGDIVSKNFMVWRSDMIKPFWERNNLPKYFKKDYDHYWITYVTFEKSQKTEIF